MFLLVLSLAPSSFKLSLSKMASKDFSANNRKNFISTSWMPKRFAILWCITNVLPLKITRKYSRMISGLELDCFRTLVEYSSYSNPFYNLSVPHLAYKAWKRGTPYSKKFKAALSWSSEVLLSKSSIRLDSLRCYYIVFSHSLYWKFVY